MSAPRASRAHRFERQGFDIIDGVFDAAELAALDSRLAGLTAGKAGSRRMLEHAWCRVLAGRLRQHLAAQDILERDHVAIQCIYFEKSAELNWLVPLHQDLSLPVAERIEHAELAGWSEKEGSLYVQPPAGVLERVVAVRLHVDDCGVDDGALAVVPGSHRLGRLDVAGVTAARAHAGEILCPVPRGGVMAMRPLLLHASSKAHGQSRRRVLHFVFGPGTLPYGLRWSLQA
ncbi:MAG: phytanoyl-CoA dioxygenase family protein [Gammaproteobacteria bacterium]